jgi:hypothetical protein
MKIRGNSPQRGLPRTDFVKQEQGMINAQGLETRLMKKGKACAWPATYVQKAGAYGKITQSEGAARKAETARAERVAGHPPQRRPLIAEFRSAPRIGHLPQPEYR